MSAPIQRSPRLVELLFQYHGGQYSPIYSVASRLNAGCEVARDDEYVKRSIEDLRKHQVWASTEAPVEAEDESDTRAVHMRETEELIDWLSEERDLIAHRRCGQVDLFIECKEPDRSRPHVWWYSVRVQVEMRPGELARWETTILEPMVSQVAVDSPEAYDQVASAALSFATCGETGGTWPDETEQQAFEEAVEFNQEFDDYLIVRPEEAVAA